MPAGHTAVPKRKRRNLEQTLLEHMRGKYYHIYLSRFRESFCLVSSEQNHVDKHDIDVSNDVLNVLHLCTCILFNYYANVGCNCHVTMHSAHWLCSCVPKLCCGYEAP